MEEVTQDVEEDVCVEEVTQDVEEDAYVEEVTEDVEGSILNFFLGCFRRELSSSEPDIKDGRLYGQNYEEIMVTDLSKYLFQCILMNFNTFHLAGAVPA